MDLQWRGEKGLEEGDLGVMDDTELGPLMPLCGHHQMKTLLHVWCLLFFRGPSGILILPSCLLKSCSCGELSKSSNFCITNPNLALSDWGSMKENCHLYCPHGLCNYHTFILPNDLETLV